MICHQCISKSSSSFRGHALFHYTWQNAHLCVTRLTVSHKSDSFLLLVIQEKQWYPCVSCSCWSFTNFQILAQPLCCQNHSQSLPTNLKWTSQKLFSCNHILRAPAYWGCANGRETRGSPRLACAGISQNLPTDSKKNLCKSHGHGMLGYLPLPPPSARHWTFLRHTWQLTGRKNGCAKAGHELQEQLKASSFFSFWFGFRTAVLKQFLSNTYWH